MGAKRSHNSFSSVDVLRYDEYSPHPMFPHMVFASHSLNRYPGCLPKQNPRLEISEDYGVVYRVGCACGAIALEHFTAGT